MMAMVNLRIWNFHKCEGTNLHQLTYFECKDLCGRIQPAIASTNSIAAGLQLLQMVQSIAASKTQSRYLIIHGFSDYKIESVLPHKPTYDCQLCSNRNFFIKIHINYHTTTVNDV